MGPRTLRPLVVLSLFGVVLLAAQHAPLAQVRPIVLRNVTVIDGSGGASGPAMDVVMTGSRITAVGRSAAVPAQAQVIDGTGKFVIPGLWDMHLHLRGEVPLARFNTYGEALLLAYGVTGVRIMAGLPRFHQIQHAIDAGQAWGPRIAIGSRNMDGPIPRQALPPAFGDAAAEAGEWQSVNLGEIPRAFQITTAAHARAAIAETKQTGVEFVKIHNELTPEAYYAIATEARAAGLYLTGHVPTGVSVASMSDTGTRSIEHFGGMLEGCSTREDELLEASLAALSLPAADRNRRTAEIRRLAAESFSEQKCAALAARLVKNGTWLSPTFMPEGGVRALSVRRASLAKYVPMPLRMRWEQQAAAAAEPARRSPEEQALAALVDERRKQIVTIMRRGGVQFVPGTDSGGAWRIPGLSLHESLVEMNRAGLTPMEVIEAATSSSARLLRKDRDLGVVQRGKLADLVVLDANPLQDIANTQKINAVVVNGRLMDRAALDDMLAQLAAAAAQAQ